MAIRIVCVFLANYLFGKLIPINVIHESFMCWQVAIFSNKLLLPSSAIFLQQQQLVLETSVCMCVCVRQAAIAAAAA